MTINNTKVVDLNIKKDYRVLDFSDFQKQNIKFDINKLQEAYNQIVQIKKFDDGGGVTHFGAISLTQIPGDPDSIKGSKARGDLGSFNKILTRPNLYFEDNTSYTSLNMYFHSL